MALRTPLSVTPHLYMGDSTGRPLDMGTVYFGEQDKDPEFYPINLFSDDALTLPLAQPVHTKGGYLYDKGDMVEPHAKEIIYSVKVLDSYGRKVFYKGAMMRNSWNDDVIEQINTSIIGSADAARQVAIDITNDAINNTAVEGGVLADTFVTATANGVGSVARTQRDKNAETVSIEDFGASTSNADNTTQINNANAYALSVGASVKYPNGEFTVLGDIPNLHNVRAYGTGAIVREGYKFYIEPNNEQQNTLYVKPSGAGDGLSKTSAMGIPQIMGALKNLQGRSKLGKWRVHLCAGTYTDNGIRFTDIPSFNNRLEFTGDLKLEGEHDTIWDGSTSNNSYALRADLSCAPLRITVKDIKIINFDRNPSNAGGLVFWGGHNLITENVWVENCPIGTWVSRNSQHRSRGDTYKNCDTWGIACQYSSSVVVGLSDKRTKFISCSKGLHVGRASVGHNDYADYEGNDYDLYVTQNSRITHINPTYKGWKIASHYIQNGAINEAVNVGIYDADSITDATPILYTENAAVIDIVQAKGLELLHQSYVPPSLTPVTGTTEQTHLSADVGAGAWLRLPKNMLYQGEGLTIRYRARIQGTSTTDAGEFNLHGGGSSASLQIISFALPNGGYSGFVEVHIDFRKDGGMFAYGTLTTNYGVVYKSKTISATSMDANFRDKTNELALWRTYLKPAAVEDTFTLLSLKTWVTL